MLVLRIKVFFLLLSFLGVQLISMGCTIINMAHEYAHSKIATEENHQDHSHHQHHSHDNDTKTNTETDSEKESCCVENATVFLQGLEAISQEVNYVLNPTNLLATVSKEQTPPIAVAKDILFTEIRPPPIHLLCGFLKRILFQSFQL